MWRLLVSREQWRAWRLSVWRVTYTHARTRNHTCMFATRGVDPFPPLCLINIRTQAVKAVATEASKRAHALARLAAEAEAAAGALCLE